MCEKIEDFWNWFLAQHRRLHTAEYSDDSLLDEVQDALRAVDARLAFEIGPPEPVREFVISADGLIDVFPAIVSLMSAAPSLPQ